MKHRIPRSLFFHLVFILTIAALTINVAVFSFMHFTNRDYMESRLSLQLKNYAKYITEEIGNPPDRTKAERLAEELSLKIAYIGPETSWKTHLNMPQPSEFMQHKDHEQSGLGRMHGHFFFAYHAKGGTFIFLPERIDHPRRQRAVTALLVFLSLVILFSWIILRKLLLPLRRMEQAFEDISNGKLDTRLNLKRPRELMRMADGFNRMVIKIGEMIKARDQILRDVSHELRTPLTRIKLALNFFPDSEEKNSVNEDVRELENIISEILETHRIAEGDRKNHPENYERFNPAKITDRALHFIKKSHSDRKIDVIYPNEPIELFADGDKIIRLLRNLLENAIKNSSDESTVAMELSKEGNQAVWRIRDEGVGISDEHKEKIFEPFFQVKPERSPGKIGYGLGLYLCRAIAEAHGGSISVEDNIPSGSVFTVRLPIFHQSG